MDGEINYKTDIYDKQLIEAQEYQDYICMKLIHKGIILSNFSSQKYQIEIGENLQGFEIKFDHLFRDTNNLYIEISEKSHPNNPNYVDSGIYRIDNTWIYAIGDYDGIYLMQKKVLIAMNDKNRYKVVENNFKTSNGFLLPVIDAEKYFNYITFNNIYNLNLNQARGE